MSGPLATTDPSWALTDLLGTGSARQRIEYLLREAGEMTATAISVIGDAGNWQHTCSLRCEPTGRQTTSIEVAAVMDTNDELRGTMLVGSQASAVDRIGLLLTPDESGQNLSTRERSQEAANIVASIYLNGLQSVLSEAGHAGGTWRHVDASDRCFLPSPPRFLRLSVDTMIERAMGGQGLGDRGWLVEHIFSFEDSRFGVIWIPTAEALLNLGRLGTTPVMS